MLVRIAVVAVLFAAGIMIGGPGFAVAQDDGTLIIKDVSADNDDYVDITPQKLSKLYWALGKFDINNYKVIDAYLMINDCELYQNYYHNDFEWQKIREATRDYLLSHKSELPVRFEIMKEIGLGRYDVEKEVFTVNEEDVVREIRHIDFAVNEHGYGRKSCLGMREIPEYPPNLIVLLDQRITLEEIPVKPELARLYINEAKRIYAELPPELQMQQYRRRAFIRLKFTVTMYKETTYVRRGQTRAVVFGQLDGYEIYADTGKTKPLFIKKYKKRRFREVSTTADGAEN